MIHATLMIEDSVITAMSVQGDADILKVSITDLHSGNQVFESMTHAEFAAMTCLALGMGEDKIIDAVTTADLYLRLSHYIARWPKEVIPVP